MDTPIASKFSRWINVSVCFSGGFISALSYVNVTGRLLGYDTRSLCVCVFVAHTTQCMD